MRVSAVLVILLSFAVPLSIGQQQGYYVLDGFGGVHAGGGAPAVDPQTPYFGFDAAKDIVYVPAGSSGNDGVLVLDAFGGVHAGGAIAGGSLNPPTPYFGFDIARGIAARGAGVSGWERRGSPCLTLNSGFAAGGSTSCSAGKKLTGGGIVHFTDNTCSTPYISFAQSTRLVTHSGPATDNTWSAGLLNNTGGPIYYRRYVICVNAN